MKYLILILLLSSNVYAYERCQDPALQCTNPKNNFPELCSRIKNLPLCKKPVGVDYSNIKVIDQSTETREQIDDAVIYLQDSQAIPTYYPQH